MCHFIFIILPARADLDAMNTLCIKYGLNFAKQEPSVEIIQKWLNNDEQCYCTTAGLCDCGTALLNFEASYYSKKNTNEILAKKTEKLKRRGWSQHKVDSWLAQKLFVRDKTEQAAKVAESKSFRQWHQFLATALRNNLTPYIGLLIFWDDKDTVLSGRMPHKLGGIMEKLEQNKIYEISL